MVAVELPAYQKKENWGSAETFYQLVRAFAVRGVPSERARCNILGPTALGFRHRDDVEEIVSLLGRLGVVVNVIAPLGATPADLARLGDASFNIVLYPETGLQAASWLYRSFGQKMTKTVPIGVGATRDFIAEVAELAGVDPSPLLTADESRLPWYSRSVDFDLSDRQTGLHFWRCDPCDRRRSDRVRGTWLQCCRARLLRP